MFTQPLLSAVTYPWAVSLHMVQIPPGTQYQNTFLITIPGSLIEIAVVLCPGVETGAECL